MIMAPGKWWHWSTRRAYVACLIGIVLTLCQTIPHAKGQRDNGSLVVVQALPPSYFSVTTPTATEPLLRHKASTEPAELSEESFTSESSFLSSEDVSSSNNSQPDHPNSSSETSSSSQEMEGLSAQSAEDAQQSMVVTAASNNQYETSSNTSPKLLTEPTEDHLIGNVTTRPMVTNATTTTTTTTPASIAEDTTESESTESNCTGRPFIDLARTGSLERYRHQRTFAPVPTIRAERSQRTSEPQVQLLSARSGAGQELPPASGENEDVELHAAQYGYRMYRLEGDLMLTVMMETDDFGATLLAIDRINDLRLLASGGDASIGLNIIHLLNISLSQRTLQQEVNILKECSTNTIGIFVSPRLWPSVRLLSETLDYNIFPLPSTNDALFAKAAHLLYELPWTNSNSSAMVYSGSNELSTRFNAICRHEHLCLENYPSSDTIYIQLGLEPAISFAINGTLVLVLTAHDRLYLPDLPVGAYVIAEAELNVASLGHSWERYGTSIRGSELLVTGGLLLEVIDLLNRPGSDCRNASIECMNNWKYHAKRSSTEVLNHLQLKNATQSIKFELRQKRTIVHVRANDTEPAATADADPDATELKLVASSNAITNYTTVYGRLATSPDAPSKLGTIFYCAKEFEIRHPDFIERHHRPPVYYGTSTDAEEYGDMYWQLKMEAWVAAGLTVSSLGILLCAAILIFLIVRVCMDDILEGHPLGSILLLISLILQFAAFIPFSLEYTGYTTDLAGHRTDTMLTWNAHCTVKIFLVSMCYCMTFSLLLCRAIMLASIGSEGGFLSHINGYIQSVICGFSTLVQLGLSTQLVIVLHANAHSISCGEIYYGHWFWAVIAYDGVLLVSLIFLAPFIFRSQRNYREGLLLVTGSVLCLVIWTVWIPLCMFGYEWREAAISLGMVATALAVLVGIMIPRCFLMVRSIARSDLVQALPSLTSLAFAQANQFISDQSVYECVNPAMRQRSPTDDSFVMDQDLDEAYSANSEIPTLPLRGQRRLRQENGTITMSTSNGTIGGNHNGTLVSPMDRPVGNVTHIAPNFYGISNPYSCSDSITSISPNKITRF
uniref:G_PROTEIN_RECEP_F3_4 domain-containing protein n=1 Tax=Anopheles coluzzii TaxID=1518534 RepID=A0A6E8VIK2_ANOCL|nr:protein bride of sevenless [Anopheles coluzzii]XP_040226990.2 protein bride of sevenless [Anopheles coluzzii]XP_040226991.2 protein bride of sevenless [Anopheles coluzzii]XP_040226992.2 protein bride of sevenless [Anopheles coluzzii]XP_040226993.2 protein bride of sevenless [Anopheles coluzzii]XP_040226997.2 protein bride of sevenless [Anopheles coluzzii]